MKQRFAMGTLGCMVSALVLTGCATLPESMPIIVTPPVDNSVHVQTQSQQVIQANEASALNGEKHGLIRQADACLDVHGDDGKTVIRYQCYGKANQLFSRHADQTIRQGDKCLDVVGEGQRDGTPVIMYACHAKANQQWYRDGQQLRNVQTGKWLTTTDQNKAVIASCQNAPNQRFMF